jgi:hypothetical protein
LAPSEQFYKIKLASGRILGPLDLERVRLLVLKNQVVGTEVARAYPQGEWQDINLIPEIAELLVAKIDGSLTQEEEPPSYHPIVPARSAAGPRACSKEPAVRFLSAISRSTRRTACRAW